MKVTVDHVEARLTDKDVIGEGGEGRVYAWRGRAVKIFHQVDRSNANASAGLALAEHRRVALAKVAAFPRLLPPEVVVPGALAYDARGEAVGYAMPLVRGAVAMGRLAQRSWRQGVVSSEGVVALLRRVHGVLRTLHARGVVVGDLNDANVLFQGEAVHFIDCDSMQLGGFPCSVAQERFLDPALYGRDLAAAPAFTPDTDWYAFFVMLFTSLVYVHPYGGAHPKLPTLLRRAEARWSVLRPDVTYPRAGIPVHVLPEDLLEHAGKVFDRGERGVFPDALLGMRWTRCACGVEHARARCPGCAKALPPVAVVSPAACRAVTVWRGAGVVVAITAEGGLRYAVATSEGVHREDGSLVAPSRAPGARYVISGVSTWIVEGERVSRVARRKVMETGSTAAFRDGAAFDANQTSAFAVQDDCVVDLARRTRVGQVIGRQTWLAVGQSVGFGFYLTSAGPFGFTFRTARGGITNLALPPWRGRLVDCAACFDGEQILFLVAVDDGGKRVHHAHALRGSSVVASLSGAPEDHPVLASVTGKCVAHGAILCASDQGLALVRVDEVARTFVLSRTFRETAPHVSASSEILAGPGGSVYVVGPGEILQLSLG